MMAPQFFEDYVIGSIRETLGRTISEADIVIHAGQTGDFYPHHMDDEWCRAQPFGRRIAHGTLIFSVGVGMSSGDINPESFSYGYDRLRFVRPVFIGDTIHVRVTVRAKRESKRADSGIVVELCEAFNQNVEVVLACEHLLMVRRKQVDSHRPLTPALGDAAAVKVGGTSGRRSGSGFTGILCGPRWCD
jgi:acyl dehydratase